MGLFELDGHLNWRKSFGAAHWVAQWERWKTGLGLIVSELCIAYMVLFVGRYSVTAAGWDSNSNGTLWRDLQFQGTERTHTPPRNLPWVPCGLGSGAAS